MPDESPTSGETPQPDQLATSNPVEQGRLELSFDLARSPADASNPFDYFKIQNGTGRLMFPYALPKTLGTGNTNVPPTMTLNVGVFTGQETLPIQEQQPVQQDLGLMLELVTQIKDDVEKQMNKLQLVENMIKQMVENKSASSAISSPSQPHNASSSNVVIPSTTPSSESPESLPTLTHIRPEMVEAETNNEVNRLEDDVVVAHDTVDATGTSTETEEDKAEAAGKIEPSVPEETPLEEDEQVSQIVEQPMQQEGSEACTHDSKAAEVSPMDEPHVSQEEEADGPQSLDSSFVSGTESANVQEEEQQDLNVAEQPDAQYDNTDVSSQSDSSVVSETEATSGQEEEPQSQAITGPIVPQEGHAHVPHFADSPDLSETEAENEQEEELQAPAVAEPVVPQGQGVAPIAEKPNKKRRKSKKKKRDAQKAQVEDQPQPVDNVRKRKMDVLIEVCERFVDQVLQHPRSSGKKDVPFDEALGQLNNVYKNHRKGVKKCSLTDKQMKKFLRGRLKQCDSNTKMDYFYAAFLEKYKTEPIKNEDLIILGFLYPECGRVDALIEAEAHFIGQLNTFYVKFLEGRLKQYLEIQSSRLGIKDPGIWTYYEIPDWTKSVELPYNSVESTTSYKETQLFKDQVKLWEAESHKDKISCQHYLYFKFLNKYEEDEEVEVLNRDFAYFNKYPNTWDSIGSKYLSSVFDSNRYCSLRS